MEYFPLGIDLLRRSFGRIREFVPGDAPALLPTRAGPAGILVCNEAMLPHFAGRRVAEGAAYLVNPSNDSWARDPKFAQQMFDIASLRAVEQRRFVVRASTSGPSGVVDPWGRAQSRTAPASDAVAHGAIRAASARSLYGHVGDAFGGACALGALAALVGPRARTWLESRPR
jgi:apolipoprotein N-acyltransferase